MSDLGLEQLTREAEARWNETTGGTLRAEQIRAGLLDPAAVAALTDPGWLLEPYLPSGAFVTVYGRPGSYKTFLVLDWAASVASGTWWLRRHAVAQGPVLYVMAEGVGGLRRRVAAWEAEHNVHLAGRPIAWYPRAVNLLDAEWAEGLAQVADEMGAVLVVIDTLARSMPGGDENAARDMTRLVEAADLTRTRSGAAVVLVHHTPLDGSRLRGHTSLEGAVDTNIGVETDGATITVTVDKQKDAEPAARLLLHKHPAGESLALRVGASMATGQPAGVLDMLRGLGESDLGDGLTTTAWLHSTSLPARSFYRLAKRLLDSGCCQVVSGQAGQRGAKYSLTDLGRQLVARE